jgi:hypothetical protein
MSNADDSSVAWKTDREFHQQLNLPAGFTWKSNPLRSGLEKLARAQRVAVFLDRRVDPDQKVDFTTNGTSLEAALQQLAAKIDLGVCKLDSVVYIGPASITEKLPTLAALRREEVRQLPSARQSPLLRRRELEWDFLAEPGETVQQLCREAGIEIANAAVVPHDLWPAVSLPQMTFVDRLSIVLAGFDLTFQLNETGTAIQLVPAPQSATIRRSYVVPSNPINLVAKLRQLFPEARFTNSTNQLNVEGAFDVHDAVQRLLRGESVRNRTVTQGERRYTLQVDNQPVGGVLKAVAGQLNLTMRLDPRVTSKINELISFEVKDATRDQLIEAIVKPAGLSFQVENDKLHILPATR